jgi:hypothetical protein
VLRDFQITLTEYPAGKLPEHASDEIKPSRHGDQNDREIKNKRRPVYQLRTDRSERCSRRTVAALFLRHGHSRKLNVNIRPLSICLSSKYKEDGAPVKFRPSSSDLGLNLTHQGYFGGLVIWPEQSTRQRPIFACQAPLMRHPCADGVTKPKTGRKNSHKKYDCKHLT